LIISAISDDDIAKQWTARDHRTWRPQRSASRVV